MVAIMIILMVMIGVELQFFQPKRALGNLRYTREIDKYLIEPGEELTMKHCIENQSKLPVLYLNFVAIFHKNAAFLEEESWKKSVLHYNGFEPSTQYRMYLFGRRSWSTQVHFTLNKRGVYKAGRHYLEVGDFFGFRSEVSSEEKEYEIVVMPHRSNITSIANAYSGFIGDISVQRFILEDPVLTVAFREYTGHEPMKSISFIQTAKRGSLYVKCYDHTTELHVTVLLNLFGGEEEQLESCLSIVRTVIEDLEERHISYGFASNSDVGDYLAPGLGEGHLLMLLRNLGRSKLLGFYPLEDFLEKLVQKENQSSGYILITPPLKERERNALQHFERKQSTKCCILVGGEEG